ncbi:MAG: substrate-binding domain-containing protein [Planctomycetota bacterium]|jgi:ribose transport system substrate-binding protein|nr:substrate-binding domain-containing protein [Planctomycetota bacterium]
MVSRYFKALAIVLAFMAPMFSGIARSGEKQVFGISLMSLRHPFFQEMRDEMEKTAKELDVVLRLTDADFDAGKQVRQIDDFVQQKVSAIVIAPCDSKAVAPALNKAIAAGIPVVTVDVAAEGVNVVSHCASDNIAGGRLAGGLMVGRLSERGVTEGIILIVDHSGVTSTAQRNQGFKEVASGKLPGVRIETLNAIGQRDRAMAVTEDALQRFGDDLVGVFGVNDDCALGALSAIERAEMLDQISVVGYDLGDESKTAIDEGRIVGDTVQFPALIGRYGLTTAFEFVTGKNVNPPKSNPVPVGTYTIDGFRDQQGNLVQ